MVIFFVLILFIVIAVFCLTQQKYTKATLFMLLMGFSFLVVVSCIITYLSKDAYYYYSLDRYFGISKELQNDLVFLPISRYVLIRVFNVFTMVFLYAGLASAIYSAFHILPKRGVWILSLIALPCILQVIIYDPSVYTAFYYAMYPDYMTAQGIVTLYESIHKVTWTLNTLYIVAGIVLIIYAYCDAPKVRQIRSNILMIVVTYVSVQITYYYMNYWAPDLMVKVSKAAHFISFKPINLVGNPSIYTLLPYLAGVCVLLSLYSIYKYARLQNSIRNQETVTSQNIDSALLTSRVFSHYIKNELLAIMAQTEFLESMCEKSPEVVEEIQVIEQRCRKVYDRLNVIHQKNLKSQMELKPVPLTELMDKLLGDMSMELRDIQLNYSKPQKPLTIMADSYYFSQAIENIMSNAVDALKFVPDKSRQIDVRMNVKNKWVELIIQDNGTGMEEDKLEHIFQPFYSSKPTATNWGMGLSLCHTIITSHGGKIHASSTQGEGSSFHIVMPLLLR
ncbi:sensor histidine kinase [Paenibacillus shunpengii]|uniref:histidine kinase n=1 Tax=Paenibacillus shunpengii TaxID=2054424 RepID=A0ABW5SVS0_9BACL